MQAFAQHTVQSFLYNSVLEVKDGRVDIDGKLLRHLFFVVFKHHKKPWIVFRIVLEDGHERSAERAPRGINQNDQLCFFPQSFLEALSVIDHINYAGHAAPPGQIFAEKLNLKMGQNAI